MGWFCRLEKMCTVCFWSLCYKVKQTKTNQQKYFLPSNQFIWACAMPRAKKGQQNFPIVKKTTERCPSKSSKMQRYHHHHPLPLLLPYTEKWSNCLKSFTVHCTVYCNQQRINLVFCQLCLLAVGESFPAGKHSLLSLNFQFCQRCSLTFLVEPNKQWHIFQYSRSVVAGCTE